jgi:hypothetical protein
MQNQLKQIKPAIGKLVGLKAKPKQNRKVPAKTNPFKDFTHKGPGDEPSLANWKPPFPVKK